MLLIFSSLIPLVILIGIIFGVKTTYQSDKMLVCGLCWIIFVGLFVSGLLEMIYYGH